MPKTPAHPAGNERTPTGTWLLHTVLYPWLQLGVGGVTILLAKNGPKPLSLIEGVTISLYAVSLLAGTVCAFDSNSGRRVPESTRKVTQRVFTVVVAASVLCVVLYQTGNLASMTRFLLAQAGLAAIALPFSYIARL
jgi:hypothetical protein